MHLAAIVAHTEHVCCRYRLRAFEPALAEAGHVLEYRARPRDWWSRLWPGQGLAHADAVILQRRLEGPQAVAATNMLGVGDDRGEVQAGSSVSGS